MTKMTKMTKIFTVLNNKSTFLFQIHKILALSFLVQVCPIWSNMVQFVQSFHVQPRQLQKSGATKY